MFNIYTMLLLALKKVQVFQNHSSGYHHPVKKFSSAKFRPSPPLSPPPDTRTYELFFRMVVLLLGSHFLVKYLYSFDEQSQTKDTISWIALFPIIDIFLVKYVISYSTFLKYYISNNNHNKSIKWVYNWLLKWQSFSLMDNYFLSLYLMACKIGLSSKSHWLWG